MVWGNAPEIHHDTRVAPCDAMYGQSSCENQLDADQAPRCQWAGSRFTPLKTRATAKTKKTTPSPPLSEACLVSYNSILDKTENIDTIHTRTSRAELLKTFLQLMNDPIMEAFDKKTAGTIHNHLATFLERPDTRKGEIYETCSDLASMYLRQHHASPHDHQTTLCRVQKRLREMLYAESYTVQSIADMIAGILLSSEGNP